MTFNVQARIEKLAKDIEYKFNASSELFNNRLEEYDWYNAIYHSPSYRRAHVEIVDRRDTHKIYILHCTIFPHFNDPSPIWGFDAVCGPNKITGTFLDYSSSGDPGHPMMQWFAKESGKLTWNKPRDLPDWAQQIFSPSMIAAGNVSEQAELESLCHITMKSLHYYLANVGYSQESGFDYHMAQNRYCHYQKQNPHVVRSMVSMGVEESKIRRFVDEILFPEFG
jgi:hypothetical protein